MKNMPLFTTFMDIATATHEQRLTSERYLRFLEDKLPVFLEDVST
jgi:hypothetical protein